jgi:ferrochelatase
MNALRKKSVRRLLVLPLYPQYSGTTTASGIDAIADELRTWRWVPEMRTVNQYHDDPGYIAALAESVREIWARDGEPEKLLMSFHGIPKRYFLNGDPYHCQCLKTGRLLGEKLGLSPEKYQVCFQSLFGREEWLKPYTDKTLIAWAKSGSPKKIDVMCPGFTSDCIETLEEIDVENRGYFLDNGGESYRFIPCLNDRPAFIQALAEIARRNLQGWIEESSTAAEARARESEALYKQAANSR